MRYIGIDLAWGTKNTTAAVALQAIDPNNPERGAKLIACDDALTSDDSIIAFVRTWGGGDGAGGEGALVGIDAPLLVPNQTGRRPCEAILSRCLARAQAGPHPANRNLVATGPNDTVRGETIAARLADELNIAHTPYLDTLTAPPLRACFEVFPHPAHVALFGLDKTLKYKIKPKRDLDSRLLEFDRYAAFLRALGTADPPLSLPASAADWMKRDLALLSPAALKRHEDALDAVTCAYVVLYRHRWGDARCPMVGDLATGYIVTPATDAMMACFQEAAPQPGTT